MAKVPLGLRLDPVLIAAIDQARGETPRTTWIEAAISRRLGAQPHGSKAPGVADLEQAISDAKYVLPDDELPAHLRRKHWPIAEKADDV